MAEPPSEVDASHESATLSWEASDADSLVGADGGTEKSQGLHRHVKITVTVTYGE